MPPGTGDKKPEKSYLSSAVDVINPWSTSRTATPTPDNKDGGSASAPDGTATPKGAAPGDHTTTPFYGQSFRTYPKDCPPLNVQWFHAVDVRSGFDDKKTEFRKLMRVRCRNGNPS